MKIDTGNFGYETPGAPGRVDAPTQAFVTQGLPELGAQGLKIAAEEGADRAQDAQIAYSEEHRKRVEAEAESKLVAKEAKRAEAMTIHAKGQNALNGLHDTVVNGLQDGTISVDQAPKMFTEEAAKIVDTHLKTVDKANVGLVKAGLEGDIGSLGRQVGRAVTLKNRSSIAGSLNDTLEELQRLAISDPELAKKQAAMAIDSQGPLAGYDAAHVSKMKHAFVEGATFNNLNNQLVQIKDNRGALEAFKTRLAEAKDLDPAKANVLLNQANSTIMHLENKAIASENRRLTQLAMVGRKFEDRIAMGVPMNPVELDRYLTASKGTPYEEYAQGLVQEQAQVTDLLKKPPNEQAAYVSALEQKLVTTGEGNPKLIKRLAQTVQNTHTMLEKNPLQYAMDRGGAQIQPLDITKPDSWEANLSHRSEVLTAQQRQVGGSLAALTPQEAAVFSQVMATGTPEQKKAYLEPIRRGLGNDRVFRATVQQFAKDSPVTALAATITTKEAPITVGGMLGKDSFSPGSTAALMLRGEQLLNPPKSAKGEDGKSKGFPMPDGADAKSMATTFSDTVGKVFADNAPAYDVQLQATRATYAAMMEKNGDFSGTFSPKVWAQAIGRSMSIGKFNGTPVSMPWGMGEDQFKNRVQADLPRALKDAGLLPEMAGASGRYTLQNETGSTYFLRQGTEYVTGQRGRVIVKVPELPGPARRTRDAAGVVYVDDVPQ